MRSALGLLRLRECRLRLRGLTAALVDRRRARATIGLRRREWRRRLRRGFTALARRVVRRRTVVFRRRLAAIGLPFLLAFLFLTAILAGLWTRTNFILGFYPFLKPRKPLPLPLLTC